MHRADRKCGNFAHFLTVKERKVPKLYQSFINETVRFLPEGLRWLIWIDSSVLGTQAPTLVSAATAMRGPTLFPQQTYRPALPLTDGELEALTALQTMTSEKILFFILKNFFG